MTVLGKNFTFSLVLFTNSTIPWLFFSLIFNVEISSSGSQSLAVAIPDISSQKGVLNFKYTLDVGCTQSLSMVKMGIDLIMNLKVLSLTLRTPSVSSIFFIQNSNSIPSCIPANIVQISNKCPQTLTTTGITNNTGTCCQFPTIMPLLGVLNLGILCKL